MSGQRRIGHAGTLDPLATGVLVVCAGWATRLTEYLMDGTKRYRATVRLGVTTDTYDAEGEVLASRDAADVTADTLLTTLETFVGATAQVPPMHSAIKHAGRPLYKLARRGETVERPARMVHIHELRVAEWNPPDVVLDIVCSKGTYVRSLAHDLGEKLGCGAHLAGLTRTMSGSFHLADAVSLEALAHACAQGQAAELAYPLERALENFVMLPVDEAQAQRLRYGQAIADELPDHDHDLALAMLRTGEPLAVLTYCRDTRQWQPNKVLQ